MRREPEIGYASRCRLARTTVTQPFGRKPRARAGGSHDGRLAKLSPARRAQCAATRTAGTAGTLGDGMSPTGRPEGECRSAQHEGNPVSAHEPLRLHVPEPTGRPGRDTDFSYLHLSPAGAVRRPPVDAPPVDTSDLAYALVRVLDDDGRAVGPWAPADRRRRCCAGPARHDEDARLRRPHADRAAAEQDLVLHAVPGRGGDRHRARAGARSPATCASRPTASRACCSRATTRRWSSMMCQMLSNERDPLKGRQLPVMYSYKRAGLLLDLGQPRHAVHPGGRLGAWPRRSRATRKIASAWIGDGATAEADFHTALTFAHVYRAPVILNVVNNQWAISTFQAIAGGEARPSRRAASAAASRRCASTATTSSPSTRRRAGRPSARARNLGPTLIE